jgi:hypothetical protein
LYSAVFGFPNVSTVVPGGTLNGAGVSYGSLVVNTSALTSGQPFLASARADVTSIVKPVIDAGPGGDYSFPITETVDNQDGEALVVIYRNSSLPDASVGILDGFSAVGGDDTSINFADPLHPADPGFFAEMRIGDGFSCCLVPRTATQTSLISVNGTTITENAGGDDDGGLKIDNVSANGNLITVGGSDDPFSPLNPSYEDDHERYDIKSFVTDGDTKIGVHTENPSVDDNIFLAAFYVSGKAGFNEPPPGAIPEPSTIMLLGSALVLVAARVRRKIV